MVDRVQGWAPTVQTLLTRDNYWEQQPDAKKNSQEEEYSPTTSLHGPAAKSSLTNLGVSLELAQAINKRIGSHSARICNNKHDIDRSEMRKVLAWNRSKG